MVETVGCRCAKWENRGQPMLDAYRMASKFDQLDFVCVWIQMDGLFNASTI